MDLVSGGGQGLGERSAGGAEGLGRGGHDPEGDRGQVDHRRVGPGRVRTAAGQALRHGRGEGRLVAGPRLETTRRHDGHAGRTRVLDAHHQGLAGRGAGGQRQGGAEPQHGQGAQVRLEVERTRPRLLLAHHDAERHPAQRLGDADQTAVVEGRRARVVAQRPAHGVGRIAGARGTPPRQLGAEGRRVGGAGGQQGQGVVGDSAHPVPGYHRSPTPPTRARGAPGARYSRICTGVPGRTMRESRTIHRFPTRMHPWLARVPSRSGRLVPWMATRPLPPAYSLRVFE